MHAIDALLDELIDYAGLFPPAALDMSPAVDAFARHRAGPLAEALGRFVVPVGRLGSLACWRSTMRGASATDGRLNHMAARLCADYNGHLEVCRQRSRQAAVSDWCTSRRIHLYRVAKLPRQLPRRQPEGGGGVILGRDLPRRRQRAHLRDLRLDVEFDDGRPVLGRVLLAADC